MKKNAKIMIAIALFLIVAVYAYLASTQNGSLFRGQLLNLSSPNTVSPSDSSASQLPDLTGKLEIDRAKSSKDNVSLNVEIANVGNGEISENNNFRYTIYANDQEIFSNSDSFTTLAPGDSFSFQYNITRALFKLPQTITLKLAVDENNKIKESNEANNEQTESYTF